MFIGTYYHTLEANGRVSLPKAFRTQQTEWVVTRGLDGGLFVFPAPDFITQIQELNERTFTKKAHRDFVRLMTNEATQTQVDQQGRVQLPEYLIAFAQLQKQLVVMGSMRWVEIWDRDRYHQYRDALEPQAELLAESIND